MVSGLAIETLSPLTPVPTTQSGGMTNYGYQAAINASYDVSLLLSDRAD
jgi:hypothetical protein